MTEQVVQDPTNTDEGKPGVEDYWGVDERVRFSLPNGRDWIEFQIMDEGAKSKFQRLTNQDLVINRDQSAKVRMDPAAERHALIKSSVRDWYLPKKQGGELVPILFSPQMLEKWLESAPPKIVEDLEKAIRKANPWMQNDMTLEAIDEQMRELEDLRRQVVEREAGEAGSANK